MLLLLLLWIYVFLDKCLWKVRDIYLHMYIKQVYTHINIMFIYDISSQHLYTFHGYQFILIPHNNQYCYISFPHPKFVFVLFCSPTPIKHLYFLIFFCRFANSIFVYHAEQFEANIAHWIWNGVNNEIDQSIEWNATFGSTHIIPQFQWNANCSEFGLYIWYEYKYILLGR